MKLIVDCGSTKAEWLFLDNNRVEERYISNGFNPFYSDKELLQTCLKKEIGDKIHNYNITEVYYYGSGCSTENNCNIIRDCLSPYCPKAFIEVTHDMMAAARAVLGKQKGIACILGTGSNACMYDGQDITERAVSLGYLLGDEGSGSAIGKEVLRSYFYGYMPSHLREDFFTQYGIELKDCMNQLYHNEQPSKYMASFAKFAGQHQNEAFIQELCKKCFNEFIEHFICRFPLYASVKVGFVGSVAFYFKNILIQTLNEKGIRVGDIMPTPEEGLIRYHSTRL